MPSGMIKRGTIDLTKETGLGPESGALHHEAECLKPGPSKDTQWNATNDTAEESFSKGKPKGRDGMGMCD